MAIHLSTSPPPLPSPPPPDDPWATAADASNDMVAAGAAVNDHDGCSAATILKDLLFNVQCWKS